MKFKSTSFQLLGERDNQEDSFFADDERGLYIVADGMGGHEAGEVASKIAVDAIAGDNIPASGYEAADREICALGGFGRSKPGTTAVTLDFSDGQRVSVLNVGDSRAYLIRWGVISRLTVDHNMYGNTSMLSRVLGSNERHQFEPDANWIAFRAGDRFILCSDGLTDVASDEEILRLFDAAQFQEKLEQLTPTDNLTVIVVVVEAA